MSRRRKRTAWLLGSAVALALTLWAAYSLRWSTPSPIPGAVAAPGAEERKALILDMPDAIGTWRDVVGLQGSGWHYDPDDFDLGPFVRIHAPGWPFHRVSPRTDLSQVITPYDEWLAVLYFRGGPVGAVQVLPYGSSPAEGYYITSAHDRDFALRLLELGEDEKILDFTPHSAWFVLSGDRAKPFDEYSAMYIPNEQPLSVLRDHIVQWQADGPSAAFKLVYPLIATAYWLIFRWPGLTMALALAVVSVIAFAWRRRRRALRNR